ncbi:MAG: T9SS type A sorting domain-containing protein [Bacteroidetes bacterium]|nr:T9SS type A sorting domain-containing protein [Bacteroidota bacterium]
MQFSDNIQHNVSTTDVLGRVLAKETVTAQKQVINQSWMDGVYFLNVFTQDQTRSLKFIIAK